MSRSAAEAASRPNFLSILHNRNFALLWGGQAVSQIGDGLFYVAQIWLVLQLTGSALAMGTTLILTQIPRLAFQLIGGVSVDRYDRQKLMFLSDAIRGLVVLVFAILVATKRVEMVHVYVLSIVFGIVGAFFYPAQAALVPNLVPSDRLVAANSLLGLTQQLSQVFGPVAAGILISLPSIGVAGVSYFNAASFAAGAAGLALMRLPAQTRDASGTSASFAHELRDGFRYLLGFRALVIVLLLAMILNFALAPFEVLLPVFTNAVLGYGAEALGLLTSSFGVGMVVGSLGVGAWSPKTRRGILVFVGTTMTGFLMAALGAIPVFIATVAILIMGGVLIAAVNTLLAAVMQGMIADEYRGRIFSLNMMISMGLAPIALAVAGGLADAVGPGTVFVAGGVITAVASLSGLAFPEIRAME